MTITDDILYKNVVSAADLCMPKQNISGLAAV